MPLKALSTRRLAARRANPCAGGRATEPTCSNSRADRIRCQAASSRHRVRVRTDAQPSVRSNPTVSLIPVASACSSRVSRRSKRAASGNRWQSSVVLPVLRGPQRKADCPCGRSRLGVRMYCTGGTILRNRSTNSKYTPNRKHFRDRLCDGVNSLDELVRHHANTGLDASTPASSHPSDRPSAAAMMGCAAPIPD